MNWLTGNATYDTVLLFSFGYVVFVILGSIFMPAPYGRFSSDKFGLNLSPKLGWFLMELPASLMFIYFFFQGKNCFEVVPLLFLVVWLVHYANRGFMFPLLMRTAKGAQGSFGLMVVLTGWLAVGLHGYLNATYIADVGTHFTLDWLTSPSFIVGITLYYASYVLNIHSDGIIRNLRSKEEIAQGSRVYRVPQGGLFKYVSNPSYLTELTGWAGFTLATGSPGGLFIFLISLANLLPRAFKTHQWYNENFPDYPQERKVIVPFLI